jgi:fimbrial chaperone protein
MKISFFLLLLLLLAPLAQAFRISPMVISFSPEGRGANQVLLLENPGSEKIPVQIEIFERHHADGQESRTKTAGFTVYPEQIALLPEEKRNIRITWNGAPKLDAEKAFRIVATQLPVNFKEKDSKPAKAKVSLNFMLQYVASAYVTEEAFQPKLVVKSMKVDANGLAVLVVVNEGKAHQVISQTELKIHDANGISLPTLKAREELESINLLAGETRTLKIPRSGLKSGDYRAELKYSELTE